MNSEQIRKFFADYQVVLKRVEQLEAAMRIKSDWDTWCAALRERAEFFRTEYAHMNALMRSVMPEFAKEEPALDDDAWKQLQISRRYARLGAPDGTCKDSPEALWTQQQPCRDDRCGSDIGVHKSGILPHPA